MWRSSTHTRPNPGENVTLVRGPGSPDGLQSAVLDRRTDQSRSRCSDGLTQRPPTPVEPRDGPLIHSLYLTIASPTRSPGTSVVGGALNTMSLFTASIACGTGRDVLIQLVGSLP